MCTVATKDFMSTVMHSVPLQKYAEARLGQIKVLNYRP